jgi:hypothetical protein
MEKSIHSARYAVFLKTLKEARERAGLTQVQLAKRLGETDADRSHPRSTPSRARQAHRSDRGASRSDENREFTGSGQKAVLLSVEQDSKTPANVAPTTPAKRKMSAAGRRAIIAGTKKRWVAIRSEGCCCGGGSGCRDAQGSTRQSTGASQERRSNRSGTKGTLHRNEETVGGEKEGGREKSILKHSQHFSTPHQCFSGI